MAAPLLTPAQLERYRRHLSLPEFGAEGQRKLLDSRVLLIGAGGLGCPLAQYLAAAGVGTLGLIDPDHVDVSNLQRQVLYATSDVGRPKVEVAAERIRAQNPDVRVVTHQLKLTSKNALALLADWDVIVDGSDNFPTRYLVNDACVLLGKPNVHGSIFRFDGQASVFDPRSGPCYRCLFPEPPPPGAVPSCAEGGVLGVLPGLVALIQATETLKLLAGIGESLAGRLLQIDALGMEFREFRIQKDPKCPACGEQPTLTGLIDYEEFCGMPTQPGPDLRETSVADLKRALASGEDLLLLDVREPSEHARARIEGARLLPLGQLEARLGELDAWRGRRVVVHCHHGGRSAHACLVLREHGFQRVENLAGGIDAWSLAVDPSVPRY
jgi:adenylyltransferase/sulfurtransferase